MKKSPLLFRLSLIAVFSIVAHLGFAEGSASDSAVSEEKVSAVVNVLAVEGSAISEKVNINTADAVTLAEMLDGVGSVKAEAIVAFRQANGDFKDAADLVKIKGIGEKILAKNANKISVE